MLIEKIEQWFTEEEIAAIEGKVSMTQSVFNSIMKKCGEIGPDAGPVFLQMLDEDKYECFLDSYEEQFCGRLNDELAKKIEDIRHRDLTEKELKGLKSFIVEAIAFTDEQNNAINHLIPMTQEMFDSILDRCEEFGEETDHLFFRMLDEYPDLMAVRAERIDEKAANQDYSPLSSEVSEQIRQNIYKRIREIMGEDAI